MSSLKKWLGRALFVNTIATVVSVAHDAKGHHDEVSYLESLIEPVSTEEIMGSIDNIVDTIVE